jgi:hypothetical protein
LLKSAFFYGKTHTLEARQSQANASIGKPSNFFGRKQADAVKKIVSEANAGKKDGRKPVYINSVYYESITQAHLETKLSRRLLRDRLNSKEERFQNYVWASDKDADEIKHVE